jgi:ubiquinone/menaquinone biosynthesis C-methylase UbiE
MTDPGTSATDGGPVPDANELYSLGHNRAESARLQRQAEELAPESEWLLDQLVLRPGQAAIDLGCGPRGVIDMLAARVGPKGRVVGLDADPTHIELATQFVTERGLPMVEIVQGDARQSGLPAGSFDVVHARTLLINVPEPSAVAEEMARLAKPGGWVASMEPDTEHWLCHPPHEALERIAELFLPVFSRNGADPYIGRRVAGMLRQAGLEDVGLQCRAHAVAPGSSRRTLRADLLRSMRPQIIEMGLASEAELVELDGAARAHLEDPETIIVFGLMFMTWGRKPA